MYPRIRPNKRNKYAEIGISAFRHANCGCPLHFGDVRLQPTTDFSPLHFGVYCVSVAVREGFEPSIRAVTRMTAWEAVAIDHSAISPHHLLGASQEAPFLFVARAAREVNTLFSKLLPITVEHISEGPGEYKLTAPWP